MPSPTYQIKVTLSDIRPPVWRRIVISGDVKLGDLHKIIQVAMGWNNCHLHQFILRAERGKSKKSLIALLTESGEIDALDDLLMRGCERIFSDQRSEFNDVEDERKITLAELCPNVKDKLIYEYDFGDSWMHTIVVEKIGEGEASAVAPVCLAGRRACPPEDCGGPWMYAETLEALSDPKHEMHEDSLERIGDDFDPERFDIDEINSLLERLVTVKGHRPRRRTRSWQ